MGLCDRVLIREACKYLDGLDMPFAKEIAPHGPELYRRGPCASPTALGNALRRDAADRYFDRGFAATNRLRTDGVDHLLAATRECGARRFIAQSFCGWPFARMGGPAKTEEDALDPAPPREFGNSLAAIHHLEGAVTGSTALEGVVLR